MPDPQHCDYHDNTTTQLIRYQDGFSELQKPLNRQPTGSQNMSENMAFILRRCLEKGRAGDPGMRVNKQSQQAFNPLLA